MSRDLTDHLTIHHARNEDAMDSTNEKGASLPPDEERWVSEDDEREHVESAMRSVARRRGASMPCGAFARTDWYWAWSSGVDLFDTVYLPQTDDDDSKRPPIDALELARERMASEVDDICEATSWNINEYRKTFRITLAELARSIDVSESTLRKKMSNGTLTLREFITLCAVCLTDPCVALGLVDSEDAFLVRGLHYLDKASDHRAVRELVELLSTKQGGRMSIRKSVSPAAEADLGWNRDQDAQEDGSDINWAEIRRELLPSWPLWWETRFDYTEFNKLVEEYLCITSGGWPEFVTYEMKARAASTIADLLDKDAELRSKYEQYRAVGSALSELRVNGNDLQVKPLEKVERALHAEFTKALLQAAKQNDDKEVND